MLSITSIPNGSHRFIPIDGEIRRSYLPSADTVNNLGLTDEAAAKRGIELWLNRVRERGRNPLSLMEEPSAIQILYLWGQFSSFDEVHEFFERLTSTDEGIDLFLARPPHTWNGDELTTLVSDWRRFRDRCERHSSRASLRPEIWRCFHQLEQAELVPPHQPPPDEGK